MVVAAENHISNATSMLSSRTQIVTLASTEHDRQPQPLQQQVTARQHPHPTSGALRLTDDEVLIATSRIHRVLSEFIRTSPVGRYDHETHAGVWKTAKLKLANRRTRDEYKVVVLHAPLHGVPDDVAAQYFRGERSRLRNMLVFGEPVPLTESTTGLWGGSGEPLKFLRVTSVRFAEVAEDGSMSSCQSSVTTAAEMDMSYPRQMR